MKRKLDQFFHISERKSTVRTEIIAGCTTFLAMAYILTVNPNNVLWNGTSDPRFAAVFIATAIGSFIGTMLMALLAKSPLAQSSAMGLNAIAGSIIGGAMGFAYSYGNTMALILISGIAFLLLSILPGGRNKEGKKVTLRERIFIAMPDCVKKAITVGIGLFIAFIGMQNAGLIVDNQFTLVDLVSFNDTSVWAVGEIGRSAVVALFGLIVIAILSHYKVRGSVILGIGAATILSIPLKVANLSILAGSEAGISWKFWENINSYINCKDVFFGIFRGGFDFPVGSLFTSIMLVITLAMLDMFDTMGTVVGCCKGANLLDKDGVPVNYDKMMMSDSIATCTGALFGTSTISTFVESGAGVAEGGKTGLTALTTAVLFLLSIFLLPLFAFIPTAAAAGALMYVGVLMMKNVTDLDFENPKYAVPSFVTIIITVLAYSITKGIGLGLISFFVIDVVVYIIDLIKGKEAKLETTFVTFAIVVLYLIYFLVPTML